MSEITINTAFPSISSLYPANSWNQPLLNIKTKALDDFMQKGFPNTKDEEWRFTPILSISKSDLTYGTVNANDANFKSQSLFGELVANRLVFVDGNYDASSTVILDKQALQIDMVNKTEATLDVRFNTLVDKHPAVFHSLNSAYFEDVCSIRILKNALLQYPIIIENRFSKAAHKHFIQPRFMFVAEAFSSAEVLFNYEIASDADIFANSLSECFVETNASLNLTYFIQSEEQLHFINNTLVEQAKDSKFTCSSLSLSATLMRHNLTVDMADKNSTSYLNGLYLGKGKQLVDNHLAVHHLVPHCESNQLYKGVLYDESNGVFNGKIFVHKDAQQTNAYQRNKNLLLSDKAVINTKPQLEIFADDVKCSHGATIGQLDEEAKFYLMARGISKENSYALLTYAFASEVVEKLSNEEIKNIIQRALQQQLGYQFAD